MKTLSRRLFSQLLAASPLAAREPAAAGPLPTRPLGTLGFQASILGWGAQHIGRGTEPGTVDRIVGEALESGLNYIDTAPNYGASEELVGRALQGRRDKVFLVTKIESRTRSDAMAQIKESLRRLRTDHLDAVLFHNIGREDRWGSLDFVFSKDGALAALAEAKKHGMIRHIGCSTHFAPDRVVRAFDTGQIELLMCVLNFVDPNTYAIEEKLLAEARRRNIPIIAMKVLGGPTRSAAARLSSPEDYQASVRYCWGTAGVAVSIIGFRTPEELRQGLAAARAYKPLSASELEAVKARGRALAAEWGPLRGPVT